MLYEFWTDHSKKTEYLKIAYAWNEYKELTSKGIYKESYFDKIDIDYGFLIHHNFIKHTIDESMFATLCDVLSIDYQDLSIELYKFLKKNNERNYHDIDEIICKYHLVLSAPNLIFRLQKLDIHLADAAGDMDSLAAIFMPQVLLQMYAEGLNHYEKLKNPDAFRIFAFDSCYVNISPQRQRTTESMDYYSYTDFPVLNEEDKQSSVKELFKDFIKRYNLTEDERIYGYCDSIDEYCCSTFYQMLDRGYSIKKCKNCGKYFVPLNRSDTSYCDRPALHDTSKTCREYAKYNNYLNKTRNDVTTKLHKQIYNIKRNKAKRCENIKLQQELDCFTSQAKQWKKAVKEQTKTETEYLEWLKSVKEKKV